MSAAPPIPSIPTYDRFIEPLLRCLARWPEGVAAREAHEAAADALGLDALARQQMLSSGAQLVYKNRAGWAHDRLKRAGLSDSPRRGWWQLTEAGRRFVVEHAGPLSAEQDAALAMSHIDTLLLSHVAADAWSDEMVVQPVAIPEERQSQQFGIKHLRRCHLPTNYMGGHYNGCISEAIVQTRLSCSKALGSTLLIHSVATYNHCNSPDTRSLLTRSGAQAMPRSLCRFIF